MLRKMLRNPFALRKSPAQSGQEFPLPPAAAPVDRSKVYVLHPDETRPNYLLDDCCSPIPGDDVLGFVNNDEHVVVHKVSCPKAMMLKSGYGSRLVATEWGGTADKFMARVQLEGIDRLGILEDITEALSKKLGVNIRNLTIDAENGVFKCRMTIRTDTTSTLAHIISSLKAIKGVKIARRTS